MRDFAPASSSPVASLELASRNGVLNVIKTDSAGGEFAWDRPLRDREFLRSKDIHLRDTAHGREALADEGLSVFVDFV